MGQERWRQRVEAAGEELKRLLKDLIAFPTVSPPARNTRPAQQYIADFLRRLGLEVDQWEVYPNDDNVVGRWRGSGGGRSLILNGHVDVASLEEGEAWETPPFVLTQKNGRLYGRGVSDMKGGLACGLWALALLKEAGFQPRGDILFQVGHRRRSGGSRHPGVPGAGLYGRFCHRHGFQRLAHSRPRGSHHRLD